MLQELDTVLRQRHGTGSPELTTNLYPGCPQPAKVVTDAIKRQTLLSWVCCLGMNSC